ncbi:MAG: nitroreductase family protein [Thermoproteota archaeon]|nr:nitroreductase family protein [Candidatus Brockarchaeota archaeon]MBO3763083.1 nitroreductase family protein [Candidatus Brockarchaeota archaeon]MBO3768152.1 nitroreductase family protein [Candidatus Brockarchaeota archaeon]MBO3801659.1 nitroreductase family protein [Candidatus Brockarchaeota archaeon]
MKIDPLQVKELIKTRRTVRKFLQKEVEREKIKDLIKAAMWAPSAHNSQPWRFFVITSKKTKEAFSLSMARKWEKDLRQDKVDEKTIRELTEDSHERFIFSPVIIVVFVDMSEMQRYHDEKRNNYEKVMAIQSVSAAIQNLILMAHAFGLGSNWRCAPLFAQEEVKKVLKVNLNWEPIAAISIGYPEEVPQAPKRKNIDEVVIWDEER